MIIFLLRSFWGHKAGSRGRILRRKNDTLWIYLKGSPPARVTQNDVGDLFNEKGVGSIVREVTALEKEILDLRDKKTSYKEIGEALNLKTEVIRQIEARARRKLRDQERKTGK